jgi:aminoglycoside phosphotransferase family enzyme/predicted kinase
MGVVSAVAPRPSRPMLIPHRQSEVAGDEAALVEALADPSFYPHRPPRVEHVQTHISHVFLAGPFVYKLKKPVRFSFVDATTAARRRALCEDELRLNWRLAAPVYLGVLPITRERDGRLALNGSGTVLDSVVWMRRLPAECMLDQRIRDGTVDAAMLTTLARLIADFHASAPSGPNVAVHASEAALQRAWTDVLALAEPMVGQMLPRAAHRILADFASGFLARHARLFAARRAARRIREGHGDLRAEHVCVLDAPALAPPPHVALGPGTYVIDCVEFSQALRCGDVASDVAFLAMDLERLGRPDLATTFLDAYVCASGDRQLRTLLPFYGAYRACVRGAVDGLKAGEAEVDAQERAAATERAREEFMLALRYAWQTRAPGIIACSGLSGSGKTALAVALAEATGFAHLSSDALRGARTACNSPAPYGTGRYAPAARAAVYARLCDEAAGALAAGRGAVADATFIRRTTREALASVAARHGSRVFFVECEAHPDVIRRRLDARREGPSDARWNTYLRQRDEQEPFTPAELHRTVDTGGALDDALDAVLPALWNWGTP